MNFCILLGLCYGNLPHHGLSFLQSLTKAMLLYSSAICGALVYSMPLHCHICATKQNKHPPKYSPIFHEVARGQNFWYRTDFWGPVWTRQPSPRLAVTKTTLVPHRWRCCRVTLFLKMIGEKRNKRKN